MDGGGGGEGKRHRAHKKGVAGALAVAALRCRRDGGLPSRRYPPGRGVMRGVTATALVAVGRGMDARSVCKRAKSGTVAVAGWRVCVSKETEHPSA